MAGEQEAAPPETDDAIIAELMDQQAAARDEAAEEQEPDGAEESAPAEPIAEADASADVDEAAEEPDPEDGVAEAVDEERDHDDADDSSALTAAREALEAGDLRKACQLAFGKVPEAFEVNARQWAAFRAQQRKASEKHAQRDREHQQTVARFQQEAQQVVQQLQPAAQIMAARTAYQKDGDPQLLIKLVEEIAGAEYNEVQKAILRGQRIDPTTRRMQSELEELKRQLAEKERKAQEAEQAQTAEQTKANDLRVIGEQLKGSPAEKVPKYRERVYRLLEKSLDSQGRLTMTVEEAGRKLIAIEKRRVKTSPFYKPPPKEEKPAARPAGKKPPLRRDSQNNGARVGEETDEDIIADLMRQARTQRMAARKASA